MSADPSVAVSRAPGWFVVTDQGVVLPARFDHKPDALAAHAAVVAGMRRELAREGRPGRFITERVRAAGAIRDGGRGMERFPTAAPAVSGKRVAESPSAGG